MNQVDLNRMTTPLRRVIASESARKLVIAYEIADDDVIRHYMVCPDQREVYGCDTCSNLNYIRSDAKHKMDANPKAVEYYDSAESRARRRERARALRDFDAMLPEDDY